MTSRAAVIGSPVSHSLSPAIHGASFASLGVDWTYEAIDVPLPGLPAFVATVRAGNFAGLSVTMPLKESITGLLDSLDDDAAALNAVNCVSVRGGSLRGHNTDGEGCCDALGSVGGAALAGQHVVLLGAGGTARSVALALVRRGAVVSVVNRTAENTRSLVGIVERATGTAGSVRPGAPGDIAESTVLVNTTSVGMNSTATPVDPVHLHERLVVLDAVYSPMETTLLAASRQAGAVVIDGLWMLIHQARHQQLLWFDRAADAGLMRAESLRELSRRAK